MARLRPLFVIGYGFLLVGLVLMVAWRLAGDRRFFDRPAFEAVHPDLAGARVALDGQVSKTPA